ncbi:hypothetical protein [Anaerosolibacter sp.]|uniref:hypothetical protein n=1 Tax=Anaerosolibacter sp. TaxID=1872527 RepID=UPI0039EF906C
MYFIPGILITAVTFPGVIVHEFAHYLFCKLTNTFVYEICFFRFGNPSGYVIHDKPKDGKKTLIISIGPFLVNTILGMLITMYSALAIIKFNAGTVLDFIILWLGVSIAMHSFPSTGDAKSIMAAVKSEETSLMLKILCYPIVGLIYIGAFGSAFWLDLVYGMGVTIGAAKMVANMF